MKKSNRHRPQQKNFIKDLAVQLDDDLNKTLPISIQPNGDIVFQQYVIRLNQFQNWALHHKAGHFIECFYLKTCALMAAKAYSRLDLNRFISIKQLDNRYWAHHCDSMVFGHNIKLPNISFDRYLVLLNKLEYSREKSSHYKEQISKSFKWAFAV